LVPNLPEETQVPDFQSYPPHYKEVLRTTSRPVIAALRTMLENEGIIHYVHGENFSSLYSQPARLMVLEEDAEKVKRIIREMDSRLSSKDWESPVDEFEYGPDIGEAGEGDPGVTSRGSSFIVGLILGLTVGLGAGFLAYAVYDSGRAGMDGTIRADRNHDGKTDEWVYYQNGKLKQMKADDNFDGEVDILLTYADGQIDKSTRDLDFNGIVDEMCFYRYGVQQRCEFHPNGSKLMIKMQIFENGVLQEELVDKDRDGKFDERIVYDFMENPVKTEKISKSVTQ
jgi:hypothetical protein